MVSIDTRQIYRQLKDEIMMLQRMPGTLMSENAIGNQFHISRTPVREIFKWLENDGLVDVLPQKGTFVSRISMAPLYDLMFIREATEKVAFDELARQADPYAAASLRSQLRDQKALLESGMPRAELVRAFLMADDRFHKTIYTLIGREGVWDFIFASAPQYNRFRILNDMCNQDLCEKLYARHAQILTGIETHDSAALVELSRESLYNNPANILKVMQAFPQYFLQEKINGAS